MQASNTNKNTPNDPYHNFINKWSLRIGATCSVIGYLTYLPLFTYIGLGLLFVYVMYGDIEK